MNKHHLLLEIDDQPDVLVRIIQVIHRRDGRVRSLEVKSDSSTSQVHLSIDNVKDPSQISHSLEKLIDVHTVRFVTN